MNTTSRRPPGDDERAAAVHKVSHRVLPLLLAAWFVAYLDRFNVGFAALQMNDDLGLSPAAFGFGAGLFFLSYSACELPSNLLLTRFGPRVWLGRIMITWGLVTVAMLWTAGPISFYVLRFCLGVAEAGCFPGIAFYLSQMLPLRERAFALAKLGSMTQLAIIIGGPLAGLLLSLDGVAGLAGWQWLFLLEGLPAVALGLIVLRFLPDDLVSIRELSERERQLLDVDRDSSGAESTMNSLRSVVRERRYWVWAIVFFAYNVGSSGLRVWQPTLLRTLSGASDLMVGVWSAIPPFAGAAAILLVGYSSTTRAERRWHVTIPLLCGALGLVFVSTASSAAGCLIAASVAALGVACQPPLFAAVTSVSRGVTRAAAVGFVNSIALMGSFCGPYLVGYMQGQTGSIQMPYALLSAVVLAGALLNLTIRDRA